MIEFTKEELNVLAQGLDALVRAEGKALTEHGVAGVGNGVASKLGQRFVTAASALARIGLAIEELTAREVVVPDEGEQH